MSRSHAILSCIILPLFMAACSSSQQKAESSDTTHAAPAPVATDTVARKSGMERQMELSAMLAPRECRIIGTVTAIDRTLDTVAGAPCSRFPCRATVRVDSVLGVGKSFLRVINRGEEVAVTFAHTVAPSKDVAPDL